MKKPSAFALLSTPSARKSRLNALLAASVAMTGMFAAPQARAASNEVAKIGAPSPSQRAFFGGTLLRSGNELFVGASSGSGSTGAVYVYTGEIISVTVPQKIETPQLPTGLSAKPFAPAKSFGSSLARSGNDLFVGAPSSDRVFVYSKDPSGTWTLRQTIEEAGVRFGAAMAASGDTLVIGAPRFSPRTDPPLVANAGRAYVYKINSETGDWQEVEELNAGKNTKNEYYGASVAIRGNRILVGAYGYDVVDPQTGSMTVRDAGEVYSYLPDESGSWSQGSVQRLVSPVARNRAQFGRHLALTSAGALISAPQDSGGPGLAGSVYSMRLNPALPGQLQHVQRLDPPQANLDPELNMAGWSFGSALALSDDGLSLAVGVSGASRGRSLASFVPSVGEVHVYSAQSAVEGTWRAESKVLRASDPAALDYLGGSVLIYDDGQVLAAATADDDGALDSGSVYRFNTGLPAAPAPLMPLFGLAMLGGGLIAARRRHS